jgi:transcriptional regulator with XRE-family HTH domain
MTVLLREAIGDRLRHARTNQRRTLRDISRAARVSLGYLSEVERGQKEASSELLASICEALELPLAELMHNVAADISALDTVDATAVEPRPEPVDQSAGSDPAADGGELEGGRLVGESVGNDLADLRVSSRASAPISPALRTTISAPRMAATIAA